MCCFSGPVKSVSGTQIFARPAEQGRELLAYAMTVDTANPLAMILPLPVPPGSPEGALRFIDLKGYPSLFDDLEALFPRPPSKGEGASRSLAAAAPLPQLEVVDVGDFEASFVPALKDFARLDARFRLSDAVWKKLPQYRDWGFAVFKLKAGAKTVHPMAFEFPRRDPDKLFFPTVHVHDGKVHEKAHFDHALYCQFPDFSRHPPAPWEESPAPAGRSVDADRSKGLVDKDTHVYRRRIYGNQKNQDTVV